ncbi:methyltransferase domain-containing protein, partial [bacterium]
SSDLGGARSKHLFTDARRPIGENRDIVECRGCGHAFVSPLKPQDYVSLQPSHHPLDTGEGSHERFAGMMDRMAAAWGRAPGRLLEVGCAMGGFLAVAKARGWSVLGVEPSVAVAAHAAKRHGFEVRPGDYLGVELPEAGFSAIAAIEVLEHLVDPAAALRKMRRELEPGGILYLTVPNFATKALAEEPWEKWPALDPYGHIHYFRPERLTRLLSETGFEVVSLRTQGGRHGDEQIDLVAAPRHPAGVRLADLCEEVPEDRLPPLDRKDVSGAALTADQRAWREQGYLVLRGFIPPEVREPYRRLRERLRSPGGWRCPTPYMHFKELRDLGCYGPLADKLRELLSEDMGMHLNLTGWVSTERNWHQDDYLNPPFINSWYAAVWFALDTVSPECGPFEFVPGSHAWPLLRGDKVKELLTPEERSGPDWPKHSERVLNQVFEAEIAERGVRPVRFLAEAGDVLLWHGRLAHRGSRAKVPGSPRKAMIAHYSALSKRIDMPKAVRHGEGGWYFELDVPLAPEDRAALREPAVSFAERWAGLKRRLFDAS